MPPWIVWLLWPEKGQNSECTKRTYSWDCLRPAIVRLYPSAWCRLSHRGPQNPPSGSFPERLYLSLSESSLLFSSEWKQVNYKIEFLETWPVTWPTVCSEGFFSPTKHTWKKAKAGLFLSEYRPLCWFSHWRGTERWEGRKNLSDNLLACVRARWHFVAWFILIVTVFLQMVMVFSCDSGITVTLGTILDSDNNLKC